MLFAHRAASRDEKSADSIALKLEEWGSSC